MKGLNRYMILAFLACFSIIALFPAFVSGEGPALKITKITNDVTVKSAKSPGWTKATLNMGLVEGDRVRTGKNSFATLTFSYPGENCFQLYQNTEISVRELVRGEKGPLRKASIDMLRGGTWSKVKKADNEGLDFKLKTPNTVAAISGTALASIVYSDQESYFCACDGIIDIGEPGAQVKIKRCQGTLVKGSETPTKPASDKYIIMDKKYEKDPRFAWCIHCHSMMKKQAEMEKK